MPHSSAPPATAPRSPAERAPAGQARARRTPDPPVPPRLDRWPPAVRSAELLRGTAVRCGPGLRLVSWPDTPAVRAAAIAEHLTGRVASHLTAAWIWDAVRDPGARLELIVTNGRPAPGSVRRVLLHEYRLEPSDWVLVGGQRVTRPQRTVYDLLRASRFGHAERIACRVLLARLAHGRAELHEMIERRLGPFRDRARSRLHGL